MVSYYLKAELYSSQTGAWNMEVERSAGRLSLFLCFIL